MDLRCFFGKLKPARAGRKGIGTAGATDVQPACPASNQAPCPTTNEEPEFDIRRDSADAPCNNPGVVSEQVAGRAGWCRLVEASYSSGLQVKGGSVIQ